MKKFLVICVLFIIMQLQYCCCDIKDVKLRNRRSLDSHVPSISISPATLKLGITDELIVNCTVSADANNTYEGNTFVSLLASFKETNSSKFSVIGAVSSASSHKIVHEKHFHGKITGYLNNQTGGYLTIHITKPKRANAGEYKCKVSMKNELLSFSTETSPIARLSIGNISVTDIAKELEHLEKRFSKIESSVTDVAGNVSKLSQSYSSFKNLVSKQLISLQKPYEWTTIQRRVDGNIDFYRTWNEYKVGFGNQETSFWLGLDKIHQLTKAGSELKVTLQYNGTTAFAHYLTFTVGDEASGYKMSVSGYDNNSTAGESLMFHSGMKFSTKDKDNDIHTTLNCAQKHHAGNWFRKCDDVNLNGDWGRKGHGSVQWKDFTGEESATFTEMQIKN